MSDEQRSHTGWIGVRVGQSFSDRPFVCRRQSTQH